MQMCEEMKLLRKELDARGIEWQDKSSICEKQHITFFDTTMFRTHFKHDGCFYSVIYGYGSYGGVSCFGDFDSKLLECMVDDNDPIGFLKAKDVLDIMDGTFDENRHYNECIK